MGGAAKVEAVHFCGHPPLLPLHSWRYQARQSSPQSSRCCSQSQLQAAAQVYSGSFLARRNNDPGVMQPGMTFTIEPMFTEGSTREKMWADKWTAVTADGGLSAQWEHTLLITDKGVEVLTAYE
jgi:Xaa-Pro aminopeptidase